MSKRRYKQGLNREQAMLLPYRVEDFVSEDHLVRVIDAFVEGLALERYGFKNSHGGVTSGQPAYAPGALLKLYIYGYLNRVTTSRRLENECYRNLEVIWLLGGLTPTYKTIADFRKHNSKALKAVNKAFFRTCNELSLYGKELVAIDGSFFKGNASQASITTRRQLEREMARVEKEFASYLSELESADQDDVTLPREVSGLQDKLAKMHDMLQEMDKRQETQVSRTDPDARRLQKSGQRVAGYNTQLAVDSKHKLIVAVDVVQDGNDSQQLASMATQAKDALEVNNLKVVADAGYYSKQQLKECEDQGLEVYVPEPDKQAQARADGRLTRDAFHYDEASDHYVCPTGHILARQGIQHKGEARNIRYAARAKDCRACPLRDECLGKGKTRYRQLYRSEHEAVVERHRERMAEDGSEYMRRRSGLAEHPFGTMKRWLGYLHFVTRGLEKVTGEMNLMVLCYNLKRAINIVGSRALIGYFGARSAVL